MKEDNQRNVMRLTGSNLLNSYFENKESTLMFNFKKRCTNLLDDVDDIDFDTTPTASLQEFFNKTFSIRIKPNVGEANFSTTNRIVAAPTSQKNIYS